MNKTQSREKMESLAEEMVSGLYRKYKHNG